MLLDYIKTLSDNELLEGLIICHPDILIYLQLEWNSRHPEDKISINKSERIS